MIALYTLALTQTLSLIGSRMTAVGLGIWVYRQTGLTTPLLLTAFFSELPGMLLGSAAGVLIDRWDRRWVLILADAGQALGTLWLLISVASGHFTIWQLYAVALLQGTFATLHGPAKNAAVTMLIPDSRRERANAMLEVAYNLAGVLSPALAGALFATIGIGGIIGIDLATFLLAVTAVFLIAIPAALPTAEGQAGRGSARAEWVAGWRFLASRRALLSLALYGVALNFLFNGSLELMVPYFIARTGSEAIAGTLLAVMSLGALAGGLLMMVWGGTRPRIHTLLLGYLLTGLMYFPLALGSSPVALGAAIFLLMVPLPIGNILGLSIWQVKTPPDLQGRVFALNAQLGFLGSTAAFLLAGPVVDRLLEPAVGHPGWAIVAPLVGEGPGAGIALLLLVTGAAVLAVTLVVYAWPLVRRLETTLPDYVPESTGY